jgi:hypothetical protein
MSAFAKLRQWANRDNGRLYRARNRRLGAVETVGLSLFAAALLLWQLHATVGISNIWSYSTGAVGLLLAIAGSKRSGT